MTDKLPLGWREWIGFPELQIDRIKAKIDTGARTSALHAFRVEPFTRNSQQWVRFAIHPIQGKTDAVVQCEAPVLDRRTVRDSGGHDELRYVIEVLIKIGEQQMRCEFTLTDRDSMTFRVLLGRSALRGKFVVDPASSYLQGRMRRRKIVAHQS